MTWHLPDLFLFRELITKSVDWSELAAGESIREVVAEIGEGGDMKAPILGADPERTDEHLVGLGCRFDPDPELARLVVSGERCVERVELESPRVFDG